MALGHGFHRLNPAFLVAIVIARVSAFRVGAAGDKRAVLADFDMQSAVALRTIQFRRNAHPLDVEHAICRIVKLGFERGIELIQHGQGIRFVLFHPVQVVFQPGGELHIKDLREAGISRRSLTINPNSVG